MKTEKEIREEYQRVKDGVPHFTNCDKHVEETLQWVLESSTFEKQFEDLKEAIIKEDKKDHIVFMGMNGLVIASKDKFIKQDADGILYDLNRLEEVTLTHIDDSKWVNDFAVAKVIRALKEKIDTLLDNEGITE